MWLTIITIINPKIQWFKNTQFLIHEKKNHGLSDYPPSLEIPLLSWARSNVPRSASRAWLTGARSRLLGWHGFHHLRWDKSPPGSSNMFLAGKSMEIPPKNGGLMEKDGKILYKWGMWTTATVDYWRVSSRVSSIATFDYQSITKGVNDSMDFRGNRHRFQSVPWFSDVPLNQFGGTGPTSFTNQKAGGWTRWIRETDGKCQTYQQ